MKNLYKYFLLLFFICVVAFPKIAFAHVLETDGTIGGVLHIDPEDDPIAGETSKIYVELKDKTDKFTIQECDCSYTISEAGNLLAEGRLFQDTQSDQTAHISFPFPEKNIYSLQIHGVPNHPNSFETFTLTYTIRVSRQSLSNIDHSSSSLPFPLIAGVGFMSVIGGIFFFRNKRKKIIAVIVISTLYLHFLPVMIHAKESHMHLNPQIEHSCCLPQQVILSAAFSVRFHSFVFGQVIFTLPEIPHISPLAIHRNRSP